MTKAFRGREYMFKTVYVCFLALSKGFRYNCEKCFLSLYKPLLFSWYLLSCLLIFICSWVLPFALHTSGGLKLSARLKSLWRFLGGKHTMFLLHTCWCKWWVMGYSFLYSLYVNSIRIIWLYSWLTVQLFLLYFNLINLL